MESSDSSESAGPSRPSQKSPAEEGSVWQLIVLLAAALSAPLQVWVNSTERAQVYGYVLIGAGVFVLGLLLRFALSSLGADPLGATYAVAVFAFGVFNGGDLIDRPLGRITLFFIAAVVAAVVYRLRSVRVFRLAMAWVAIAVLAYPLILSVSKAGNERVEPDAESTGPPVASLAGEPRDVVVVVTDGYASDGVLSDLYGFDNSEVFDDLMSRGFDTNRDVIANYGRTRFSVASVLELGYVTGPMSVFSELDPTRLLEVIGGDSALAAWFKSVGYRFVYVESGWYGSRCETAVDICVGAPWPDESVYDVAYRSLFRNMPGLETGTSFSRGAQHAMTWLRNDLADYLANDVPEFIYVHVLAPHPPLFLRSDCEMEAGEGYGGFTILQPDMTDDELGNARDWYIGQVQCVNDLMEQVSVSVAEHDAIAVMFGDHGPDSLGQLYVTGAEWDADQRRERLTTMVVARVPGCSMGDIASLVNVSRRLVSCISSANLPDLDTETYETKEEGDGLTMVEVDTPVVRP